ncbi:MAG: nucleotidyltransferase family protein [Planctomycetota bacterium]|jgi:predicted nucleotidyltransferase
MAPVETKEHVLSRLRGLESRIRGLGVRRLALFGSFVRESARPDSDVDLLVEFEPARKTFDSLLDLGDLLEDALGRRVEIVTTGSLSPHIGPHILDEAEDVIRAA